MKLDLTKLKQNTPYHDTIKKKVWQAIIIEKRSQQSLQLQKD